MSDTFYQYGTVGAYAGGPAPYSPAFESISTISLEGIQSSSVELVYPRQPEFWWDGAGNQEMVDRPRAVLSFSYVFASGRNEGKIGFTIAPNNTVSALSNINGERNYYLLFNEEHQQLVGYSGWANKVMAFGNGVLNQYEFSAAVGQPTVVSASVGALNMLIQPSGSGQPLPAVNKQAGTYPTGVYTLPFFSQIVSEYFEAAPRNIVLTFDTGCAIGMALSGQNACPVQSFGFSIDIPRQGIKSVGWAYPDTRSVTWPVSIGIRASAMLNGLQVDALNRFGCPDSGVGFGVRFNNACGIDQDAFTFQFKGAKLADQSIHTAIGGFTEVSFSWALQIYDINRTGPTDPNFYLSQTGQTYSSIVFPQVGYVSGVPSLTYQLGTQCYLLIVSGPGFLDQNSVYVTDDAATIVVRAVTADGADTKDITVTVGA